MDVSTFLCLWNSFYTTFGIHGIHFTPPFQLQRPILKTKVFRSIPHHKTLFPADVSTFLCRWTGRNRKRLVATTTAGRSASWPSCTTSPGPPPSGPPRRAPSGPWREPPSGGSCSRPPAKRGRCTRVS